MVDAIGSAAEAGRWSEEDEHSVPRLAHKLKGGSAALGALDLADLCRLLQEAPDGDAPDIVAALAGLDEEARRVRRRARRPARLPSLTSGGAGATRAAPTIAM